MIHIDKSTFYPKDKSQMGALPKRVHCIQTTNYHCPTSFIAQVLSRASVVILEDPGRNVDTIVYKNSINKKKNEFFLGNEDLTVNSNIKLIDFDNNTELNTAEKVSDLIQDMFGFTSYVITRSISNIDSNKDYKWHAYIFFDVAVSQKDFFNYLKTKLPEDSWVEYLSKPSINGTRTKRLKNTYIDHSIYSSNGRKIYEHYDKSFIYVHDGMPTKRTSMGLRIPKPIKPIKDYKPEEYKPLEMDRSVLNLTDKMQYTDGTWTTVGEIIARKEPVRLVSPIDLGIKVDNSMQYYPKTQTFRDYNQGGRVYIVSDSSDETIEYDSQYAPDFDLNHKNLFILSPTGSGKTTQIINRMSHKSIFIAPKKAIVNSFAGNPDVNIMHSGLMRWSEMDETKLNVMTFDKLAGHLTSNVNLTGWNIIIDEIHTLWDSYDSSQYRRIFDKILKRGIAYNKLIVLSATQNPEYLPIKNLTVKRYINTSRVTNITFIKGVDKLDTMINGKTLIFMQSRQRNAATYDSLSERYKILNVKANTEIPDNLEDYDVILTTSVLREGYSIKSNIDTVILYNIFQPFGASGIVQSIARPRVSQPDIYVITPNSHFNETDVKIPSYGEYLELAERLSMGYSVKDLKIVQTLNVDKFKQFALMISKEDEVAVNELGVLSFMHKEIERAEKRDHKIMESNISYYLNCKIEYKQLLDENDLPGINLKEIQTSLKNSKTFSEMDRNIQILTSLKGQEAKEILSKIVEPIKNLITVEGIYYLNEEEQVQSAVNPSVFKRINQHRKNIENGLYERLESKRNSWKPGAIMKLHSLKRIFNTLDKNRTTKLTTQLLLEELSKVCIFHKLVKGIRRKNAKLKDITEIEIEDVRLYRFSRINPNQTNLKID